MMKLVKPTLKMEDAFKTMAKDYREAGEKRYREAFLDDFSFSNYIDNLIKKSEVEYLKSGYVPSTAFWLIDDSGRILGVSRLRHFLNSDLEHEGGNIGYDVPPSLRKNGYGSILLKYTLKEAKKMGLDKVLITCNTDNIGSSRIIEKNGGVLENIVISRESNKRVSRYFITL